MAVDTRKGENLSRLQANMHRLLDLPNLLPFIKASGGDKASLFLKRTLEDPAFSHFFSTRVYHLVTNLLFLGPDGYEAPSHLDHAELWVLNHCCNLLVRRNIVPWDNIEVNVSDTKSLLDCCLVTKEIETTAHPVSITTNR